jgi:ABC-type branched-subunit amino acid transport system ATPase component
VIEVENVTRRFGGITALDGVSLSVEAGTVLGVIGPNGSGKTTLLNVISGLLKPTSGIVRLAGKSIHGLLPHQLAALGVGRTFQIPRVFGRLTVLENLTVPWAASRRIGPDLRARSLAMLGLEPVSTERAGNLSHGQQKLLEIAGLLVMEPKILLLDEPFAGVAPALVDRFSQAMAHMRGDGRTIVIVEHTLRVINRLADRVVVLDKGWKVADGTPAEVKADERVRRAYYLA